MANELIVCEKLSKRYGPVEALKEIDLTIESGRIVGLLGPNGLARRRL